MLVVIRLFLSISFRVQSNYIAKNPQDFMSFYRNPIFLPFRQLCQHTGVTCTVVSAKQRPMYVCLGEAAEIIYITIYKTYCCQQCKLFVVIITSANTMLFSQNVLFKHHTVFFFLSAIILSLNKVTSPMLSYTLAVHVLPLATTSNKNSQSTQQRTWPIIMDIIDMPHYD